MRAKALFFAEDDAREVVRLLVADGYSTELTRERFAGEDDDEDAHWVVTSDAPDIALEILTEEYDAWLEFPDPEPPTPLDLPTGPRRIKKTGTPMSDRRLLLVHAHPDDETIGNGATMAKYAAEGAQVTLVTCTAGEMGEILVPELEHLAADRDDKLGEHRRTELDEAMRILGVTDHRFLGGFGKYRDSGMKWHENGHAVAADESDPRAFANADLTDAATDLVAVIREVRPHVLVTYDQFGGYGHPDHIQAHRVAMYGAALAGVTSYRRDLGEAWEIPKIYWSTMSWERMREGMRHLRELGEAAPFEGFDPDGEPPFFASPEADITTEIDAGKYGDQKVDALRAHATQITVDGPFFALSNHLGNEVLAVEHYRLAKGAVRTDGRETDLFDGAISAK